MYYILKKKLQLSPVADGDQSSPTDVVIFLKQLQLYKQRISSFILTD
jgi:hypothetical protein